MDRPAKQNVTRLCRYLPDYVIQAGGGRPAKKLVRTAMPFTSPTIILVGDGSGKHYT